ncbi:hypothetical protein D3C76_722050 [compost metagenome]
MCKPAEHARHRLADHVDHHQAGEQARQQRDDQNRFQRLETLWQACITIDRLGRVTGDKPGNDPANKPGAQGARQQPADHPRRQARAVGNGVGDIARQQRHHQLERGLAADLHQCSGECPLFLERGDAEHERQGDHQAARHYHWQHERHAGEQVLVDPGLLLPGRSLGTGRSGFLLAFGQRFVQRRLGLLEGNAGAAAVNLLAGKTFGGNFDVRRQQHHIGVGNRFGAQRIAGADRALGFHLQVVAQTLGCLLQGFGGHEGVGDTRRTCRHGNQSRRVLGHSNRLDHGIRRDIHLSVFSTTAQHRFNILQRLGRRALEQSFADETRHIHRHAGHQQHPLGRVDRCRRQLALGVRRINDFDAGAPALTLGCCLEQTGTQHTGDHGARAGSNNG